MIVLNLHGIGEPPHAISPGEREVWLTRDRLAEFLDAFGSQAEVRWSFDDGNESDVSHALPELRSRGLKASFFICAGRLNQSGYVDANAVRELCEAGMTIGSHGMDHVRWRGMTAEVLQREIVDAKRILEDVVQQPVREAACPFGDYDRRSLQALRQASFAAVYTSDGGPADEAEWLRARYTLKRNDTPASVRQMMNRAGGIAAVAMKAKSWIKRWR